MRGGQQMCFANDAVEFHCVFLWGNEQRVWYFWEQKRLGLGMSVWKSSETVICNSRKEFEACAEGSPCSAVISRQYHVQLLPVPSGYRPLPTRETTMLYNVVRLLDLKNEPIWRQIPFGAQMWYFVVIIRPSTILLPIQQKEGVTLQLRSLNSMIVIEYYVGTHFYKDIGTLPDRKRKNGECMMAATARDIKTQAFELRLKVMSSDHRVLTVWLVPAKFNGLGFTNDPRWHSEEEQTAPVQYTWNAKVLFYENSTSYSEYARYNAVAINTCIHMHAGKELYVDYDKSYELQKSSVL